MPSESTELIKFYAGTQLDFDTLVSANSILDNYLYFITDTHRIYKGLEDISVDSILVTELPRENVLNYRGKILILRELDSKSDPPRYVYSAWTYNPLYSSDTQEPAFSRIDTPLTSKEVLELYSNNYVPNVLPNDPTYQLNAPVQVKPYTLPERNKLIGIEYGAEVNVQSNWNTTDNSHDSYINNKPIISTAVVETPNDTQKVLNGVLPTTTAVINYLLPYVNDYELLAKYYVDLVNNHDGTEGYNWQVFTKELKNKLDGIEAGAEVNVQSNWNTTDTSHDSYIKNKPLLKTYNTSTKIWDTDAAGTNPDLPTITGLNNKLTTYVTDYSLLAKYYVDLVNNHDGTEGYNWQVFTKELKDKLDEIEPKAEVNVQADWTYTDQSHDSYIKNKPELHTYDNDSGTWSKTSNQSLSIATTAGVDIRLTDYVHDKTLLETYYKDLVTVGDSTSTKWAIFYDSLKTKLDGIEDKAEVNVQSNWNTTNTNDDSYIKNKPPLKTYNISTKVWDTDKNGTNPSLPTITGLDNKLSTYVTDKTLLETYYKDLVSQGDSTSTKWAIFYDSLKTKLDGIEDGAEVNIQANWDTSNTSDDSYIKNKPLLKNYNNSSKAWVTSTTSHPDLATTSGVDDRLTDYIHDKTLLETYYKDLVSQGDSSDTKWAIFYDSLKTKLDGIEDKAEVNVQSDWNTTDTSHDSYINNKPLLKTYNTSTKVWDTDKDGTNPDLPTITGLNNKLTTYVTDKTLLETYYRDLVSKGDSDNKKWAIFYDSLKTKLDGIESGAEVNIQSDWDSSTTSDDSYIKNKPSLKNYNNTNKTWVTATTSHPDLATTGGVDTRLTDYVHDKTLLETYYKDLVTKGDSTSTKWAIFYDSLKTKLDGIEDNANKYVLPTATSDTLGGIKIGSELSISNSIVNLATSGVTAGTYGNSSASTISPENSINIPSITVTNKGIVSNSADTKISLDPIPTTKYTKILEGSEKIVIKAKDDKLYYITLSDLANFCRTYSPEEGLAILTTNNLASNGGTIVEYSSPSNKTISGNLSGTATYATNLGSSTNSYNKSSLDTELNSKQSIDTGLTSLINAINSDDIGYLDKSDKSTATITAKNWYSTTETNNLLSKKANIADASFTGTATWSE